MVGGILHCVAVLFLALPLACSTIGMPHQRYAPSIESSIYPVRDLSIVLLIESPDKAADAVRLIVAASRELEKQVGIRLTVKDTILIHWPGRSREEMIGQVRLIMEYYLAAFDLAVACCEMTFLELAGYAMFGGWEGVIDAGERRFIVIRRKSVEILMHEVCHAFIFDTIHSGHGLMTGLSFQILPGVSFGRSVRLSENDRQEVLRNKNRTFGRHSTESEFLAAEAH